MTIIIQVNLSNSKCVSQLCKARKGHNSRVCHWHDTLISLLVLCLSNRYQSRDQLLRSRHTRYVLGGQCISPLVFVQPLHNRGCDTPSRLCHLTRTSKGVFAGEAARRRYTSGSFIFNLEQGS